MQLTRLTQSRSCYFPVALTTPDRRQSKTLILQKLFLEIFDPSSSIVKSGFDCRLSGVLLSCHGLADQIHLSIPFDLLL